MLGAPFGSQYTKSGIIQRRLVWPLCKDGMQIHEALLILLRMGGTHGHPWLIHVDVWQKTPQYCKVISLQVK